MIRFLQTHWADQEGPSWRSTNDYLCIHGDYAGAGLRQFQLPGTDTPSRGVVATVDGNDVTTLEVQKAAKAMIQRQFPRGGAQAAMLVPYFSQQAAEQLIDQKVVFAEAQRLGLRATDEDVRDELHHGQYGADVFSQR